MLFPILPFITEATVACLTSLATSVLLEVPPRILQIDLSPFFQEQISLVGFKKMSLVFVL